VSLRRYCAPLPPVLKHRTSQPTPMTALLSASAALAIAAAFADSPHGVSSSWSVTQVGEPLPTLISPDYLEPENEASTLRRNYLSEKLRAGGDNTTGSARQTTWSVGTNAKRTLSSPAAQESPAQPLKRRLAAKRTNVDDKSALIDLCEANRGEWCASWSADGYGSDPCRDKWAGVHCDAGQFRVAGL
jgi:hypothetical protein